jgi:hypothetical protein
MTKPRERWNTKNSQRGVALIAALITLLLIAAITAGMIILSNTETNISSNFRDQQNAYFASRGGLSEVRDRMRPLATDTVSAYIPTALPGTSNGILYIINPLAGETVAPWNTTPDPIGGPRHYPDDELCTEVTCSGGVPAAGSWYVNPAGTPGKGSTTYAATPQLPWKWVRLMPKINRSDVTTRVVSVDGASGVGQPTYGQRVCWDQVNNHEVVTASATCQAASINYVSVFELTSLAVTPSGSRRMSQFELAELTLPPLPGALVFDGPTTGFPGAGFPTNPNSAAFGVSGTDLAQGPNAGVGCGAATNQPAVGTYDANSFGTIDGQLNKPQSYSSSAPYPTTNAVSNVNAQLGPLSTVDGLTNLANEVIAAAGSNVYTSPAVPLNWGTNGAPVINVINGDYSGSISGGSGILLVTGTLTMNGGPSYNGLVLVIGEGNVVKNGGGGGTLNGSLFLGNLYTDLNYTTKIALGANLAPGPTTMVWNGGGNSNINYDSCWINMIGKTLPLRLVTSREMIY